MWEECMQGCLWRTILALLVYASGLMWEMVREDGSGEEAGRPL